MTDFDIIIIGGGMAGASLGAEVAPHARVLILEMEDVAGYHATGRSVSFWEESYGGPQVQPLTSASGPLLTTPDPDFADTGFLTPRGALHIGRAEDRAVRDDFIRAFSGSGVRFEALEGIDVARRIPGLRSAWTLGLAEPSTADIDVAALHAAYLRRFARHGGTMWNAARLIAARHDTQGWHVETTAGSCRCATLVDAAGAWADDVARLCGVAPLGIAPLQRTVVQLRVDANVPADMPVVMDLNGSFYFKPIGGRCLWLSPHDEEPSPPCDAAPEELAVAIAIDRLEQVVDWPIVAVERKWAGLRSFAPDRRPVYGRDSAQPHFFWFAGQGGFGIQTAPAAALIGAALLLDHAPAAAVSTIDAEAYSPRRFHALPLVSAANAG
ncbi:NAD(P)/FAD-dependent oxidoreductase [Sphingobium algorifonticola]|uniref:FAD-binding oxidoreductase n=1 Tax=Sphingobium algorifonticola TaxID=2008318 RepID=A0A437J9J8_9SPHN|nr:FAD-dependent oxidoreductase [Sphingobium algorifonticola]RVT42186.1 FAD-binding oxidoreductase [Sphingobium algorifonticola]